MLAIDAFLQKKLSDRKIQGNLRTLRQSTSGVDFCSNDYLGLARSEELKTLVNSRLGINRNGSTGSRLISGNSSLAEEVEWEIAQFHGAQAGLLFNSGYNANSGLLSCITDAGDTILYDELSHASIREGKRLAFAKAIPFRHNDLTDLHQKIEQAQGRVVVVVESLYSMDGDEPPLTELAAICQEKGAALIVDEAHATGVFGPQGRGLVAELGLEQAVWARIHTFGKAMGGHGAIVLGSELLRDYLINFARSFVFTTALPDHSLLSIQAAYQLLQQSDLPQQLTQKRAYFFDQLSGAVRQLLIPGRSPIFSLIYPGNEALRVLASHLQKEGYDVRPILSPTVPLGKERLRICIHTFNTKADLKGLAEQLNAWFKTSSLTTCVGPTTVKQV